MTANPAPVDLRSDTVTRPDAPMLEALRSAPLGDDVFRDDPTVEALEQRAAALFGKAAAVLVPSGTMANAIAVGAHTRPGDEIVVEGLSHTFNFECGGAARLWGVQARPIPGDRGRLELEAIRVAVRPDDIHMPRTRLVVLEQTSNIAGGCVLPLQYLGEVGALCSELGLRLHIDGARIFNASVASGTAVADYAARADSVMFCLSKGLGAPIGSVLVGDGELIDEARRLRKLLGGGMRQAGIVAACGLHALEHNVARLADDHRRAAELARRVEELEAPEVIVEPPETNMVFLRSARPPSAPRHRLWVEGLRARGVLAVALGDRGVRLVLHKDVDDDGLERAWDALRDALSTDG